MLHLKNDFDLDSIVKGFNNQGHVHSFTRFLYSVIAQPNLERSRGECQSCQLANQCSDEQLSKVLRCQP